MTADQVKEPPRLTKQLADAAAAGARITTLDGLPVRLEPRGRRDPWPWIDDRGNRHPGTRCTVAVTELARRKPERPRRLTRGEIRRIAEQTGIDWEKELGRAW
jgi:hypothetical protein